MNKYLILFILFNLSKITSQSTFCTLELGKNENNIKSIECTFSICEDSINIYKYHPISDLEIKTIRLRWILFSDDDGGNGFNRKLIWEYIPILNDIYSNYRFRFEVFDIVNFNNTEINHAERNEWEERVDFYKSYVEYQDELINIIVTKEFGGWDNRGFATFPFDIPILDYYTFPERHGVIVINQLLITPEYEGYKHAMPHEIGHILGLMHPDLNNADCQNDCNETVSNSNFPKATKPYQTGDFISDTYPHPSPNSLPYYDSPCEFDTSQIIVDECTGLRFYNPFLNMKNYMGYFFNCEHQFTYEQSLRMHCFIESYYPNYIHLLNSTEQQNISNSYSIYPNPNNGYFELVGEQLSEETYLEVWNLNGEQIMNTQIYNYGQIDLTTLNSGLYIYSVHDKMKKSIFMDKLIIVK